jgi:hypothetical protein
MNIETIEEMDLKPGQSVMAIMDKTGDTKTIWDRNNEVEVEAARAQFKLFQKKGYTAFKVVGKDGTKGEKMHDFDETAERIIFAPPRVAG